MELLKKIDVFFKENGFDTLKDYKVSLETEISKQDHIFFSNYTFSRFNGIIANYPKYPSDSYVHPSFIKDADDIEDKYGIEILCKYHKLMLISCMEVMEDRPGYRFLNEELIPFFFEGISMLVKKLFGKNNQVFTFPQFTQYLNICLLTRVTVGINYIMKEDIPYKFITCNGLPQFIKSAKLLLKLKGFKPFFRLHLERYDHPILRKEFNPEGWILMFKRIAQLIKEDKSVRGVCGSSWIFDPLLKDISPEIAYMNKIFVDNGAHIFKLTSTEEAVKFATFMNGKRKKLYEEGSYTPTNYAVIFTREEFIKKFS